MKNKWQEIILIILFILALVIAIIFMAAFYRFEPWAWAAASIAALIPAIPLGLAIWGVFRGS